MKNSNNIRPADLKGVDKVNRMKSLMGIVPLSENVKRSVVELTKLGPDGKVYGIVRENHKYFIKVTDKTENPITEDFQYIGGLQNKLEKAYDSYSSATKQLNLKFLSLNEAIGGSETINVLKNDNLLDEGFDSYPENPKSSQPDTLLGTVKSPGKNDGHDEEIIDEENDVNEDEDAITEDEDAIEEEVELTETEKAIDKMINEVKRSLAKQAHDAIANDKLSITTAIQKINEGSVSSKKKV
tara:strand:+ start:6199 stop:6921 length:723 start_codon:yes stop_codon:yes gene_type:complete